VSKIINEYKRRKRKDNNKLYLFKNGNFYIFIGDDVNTINELMVLKKTKFSNEYDKCGFPISKIDDYKRVFSNLKLNVEIIDDVNYDPIKDLNNIDLKALSKNELIDLINDIKDYYE